MRLFVLFVLSLSAFAQKPDDQEVIGPVQLLFDAMKGHDAAAARALFVPGATLIAIRSNGKVTVSTSEEFATHVGAAKDIWLERMWTPKVLFKGNMAVVWAPYDFHLGGKFTHCGIDSVTLAKLEGQWKIAGISYTVETEGCPVSPLGPVH